MSALLICFVTIAKAPKCPSAPRVDNTSATCQSLVIKNSIHTCMVRDFLLGTTEKTRKRRIFTLLCKCSRPTPRVLQFLRPSGYEHLHHARAAVPVAISSVSIYSKLQSEDYKVSDPSSTAHEPYQRGAGIYIVRSRVVFTLPPSTRKPCRTENIYIQGLDGRCTIKCADDCLLKNPERGCPHPYNCHDKSSHEMSTRDKRKEKKKKKGGGEVGIILHRHDHVFHLPPPYAPSSRDTA